MCRANIQREKFKIEEQVSHFIYIGNVILELRKDTDMKLQRYNKMNIIIQLEVF